MRVFNIPSSAPFLRTLITALVDGALIPGFNARAQPEKLMQTTLYLPTRRACLLARDIFLDVLGTDAVVLPRLVQLGQIDENEIEFAGADGADTSGFGDSASIDIPSTLGDLTRRMALAELVAMWAKQLDPKDPLASPLVVGGPASTLALATDLATLMDDMVTRGVDYTSLDGIVPDALDKYWQLTLNFLRIAKEHWPLYLQQKHKIEPMARRALLIRAEAKRLLEHQDGPVIAAGSTGSTPSTAEFLREVARLPHGAVVLPGLDMDLEDGAWKLIGRTEGDTPTPAMTNHPQHAMHALLSTYFGIERRDVMQLAAPAAHGRELLASEIMRPSSATARWYARLTEPAVETRIAAGMQNLTVISTPNPEMEALAIAIAMREAREQNKTAALITPDRALARRVTAALTRWNLVFDDSGGDSLTDSSAGIFARLSAEAATEELEPPTLLALLKHPLFRLGRGRGGWTRAIETLELALLRGTRPSPGTKGLAQDFANFRVELAKARANEHSMIHRGEVRAGLSDHKLDEAAALIAALGAAFAPLEQINPHAAVDFSELVRQHRQVIIALSIDSSDGSGDVQAFAGVTDGKALRGAFDELEGQAPISKLMVPPGDYADVFVTAFGDIIVRQPEVADARLRIYGTIDARLTQADRVILGGLVEGIWPPSPRVDPWLSRPMRHQLQLDLPERRIGLSAHDFAQMLGADEVILSHSAKVGGAPAVASRFLHRLEAVAGKPRWKAAIDAGKIYADYAAELDRPETVTPISKPAPTPPREARPLRMSVTGIEDWLRDPYTIYAHHILRLAPLDPVDMPLSAADRGSAIHNSIGDFTEAYRTPDLPDDAAGVLRDFGMKHFAPLMARPEARALWWPRFLRIAGWFAGWELERRAGVLGIHAETRGEIAIPLDGGRVFRLSARADRIERRSDHTYAILDYKTGQPPTGKQVRMGLSPQLSLEAAILRSGGFDGIARGSSVSELLYVRLSGNNPPGEERPLKLKGDDDDQEVFPDDVADEALQKLTALIRKFEDETTPYTSLNLAMWANRYGSYDDLARIKEWSATTGSEGGEA